MLNRIFLIFDRLKDRLLTFWEKYIGTYGQSVKDGYKSNAFSPLVWFLVFVIPILVILIYFINNPIIQYILVGLVVLLILFALLMYFLLFNKDPNLLQSENFRIEHKKMDMIAQKGGEIKIKPVDLGPMAQLGGGTQSD